MTGISLLSCLFLFLSTLGGYHLVEAQNVQVVIDAYPNTPAQGSTLILVCRVVGLPSTSVVSYQWTCPEDFCDTGGVDPEWAVRIQQGHILVVNVRNNDDNGDYTCSVRVDEQPVGTDAYALAITNGLSLLNEDGGLRVFFPRNSFVTNTTLTSTNMPPGPTSIQGNDHFVCISNPIQSTVAWHNGNGQLMACAETCRDCGPRCIENGAVGVDPPVNGQHNIHIYTDSTVAYINQDLECRASSEPAFIGVYLKDGVSPTLQPPSITQGTTSATTVNVSWSQVMGATGYYVSYQRQDLGTPPVVTPQYERIVDEAGAIATSVTLSGLEPGTTYRIRVWSRDGTPGSSSMVSSMSTEMNVATDESVPTEPRMLTMIGVPTGRTIELNWLPPLHPNGAIQYEIEYEAVMTPGDTVNAGSSSNLYHSLILPNEFVTYDVRVAAVNTQGRTTSSVISVCPGMNQQSTEPQPPTGVSVDVTGTDSAVVSWDESQSRMCDVVIGNYSVMYLQNGTSNSRIVYSTSTSITLLGLVSNAEYTVSVAAINSIGDSSAFSTTSTFLVTPTAAPATDDTAVIASVVVILLLLVIGGIAAAAIIVFIFWTRKKKAKSYESSSVATSKAMYEQKRDAVECDYAEVTDREGHPVAPVKPEVAPYRRNDKPADQAFSDVTSKAKLPPAKPSPYKGDVNKSDKLAMNDGAFDGYLKQVESMHSQGKACFEAEFNSIDKTTASSTSVAELNSVKNRYKNIFPYDSTRVVLSVPNSSGTDYINASFVDGYQREKSFIASQAPVPGTVSDFWQMMWDQRLNIVVMLTRTMEGTKRKSEDYYPESPGDTFSSGRFQIRTISLKYHVDYEVRVFEVAQVSDPSQTRTFDHYLFTGWPDYGVPKYPTSLIRMLYHVRDARVSDVPIMVHCSAGVGRTGTFIALDITLDQMRAEKKVDVKGTVERMRAKRMHMIQTVEQYIFVYDAVRELLLLGDTTIKASDFRRALTQLKSKSGGKTGFQQQFASLTTLTQESADDERVEEGPQVIRYLNRVPIKGKHLYVTRPDAGGTFFVNASYVDGYHAPRAFIAAQSPMQATVNDFWTLIAEKKVQTALLLCPLMEDSQEACHQFWPAEGNMMDVGKMKIVLLRQTSSIDFDTYKITIQKPRSTQDVTVLHCKQWPEKKRPKSASFLKLFTSAQKLQQPHSDKPIVVACNDGLGRTGTFIAIWSLIEQMKAEGQIDVVGTIKSIRTQRPGAVPHLDQFVYCHDLLLEYVDSFEGYSNFNI